MSKNVETHVGSLEEMGKRFIDAWHRAKRGEKVDESHRTFHSLTALLAALTPKRLELLRYVRHHRVRSIKGLAADLGRNYKNVHQDVEELVRLDLLRRTSDEVIAPYAEIEARFVL